MCFCVCVRRYTPPLSRDRSSAVACNEVFSDFAREVGESGEVGERECVSVYVSVCGEVAHLSRSVGRREETSSVCGGRGWVAR